MSNELLRKLPKVDDLLRSEELQILAKGYDQEYLVQIIRSELEKLRTRILDNRYDGDDIDTDELIRSVRDSFCKEFDFGLKKIINGTGVVLHTNLGRAPMSPEVKRVMDEILYGYCNLEYEIENGTRGSRHDHLKGLIRKLTGAEDVLVVNNNAAAVMLVLSTLAKGKEVIVSRGELVEIGGSFRIPKVMEHSGAILREVGSTNKTHLRDYEEAVGEHTAALMKVHTSNFKVLGFTSAVSIKELKPLAEKYDLPIIDDLGSGVFLDLRKYGLEYEPTVIDSLAAGADIVTFSGDKLMGAAQCGVIVGKAKYIAQMKKNNLLRALRVDKMTIVALTATLELYLRSEDLEQRIPVLQMLGQSKQDLARKRDALLHKILEQAPALEPQLQAVDCRSMVGGGSLPTQLIDSCALQIRPTAQSTASFEKAMRITKPHIIGRVEEDSYLLDLRTIFEHEIPAVADKIAALL